VYGKCEAPGRFDFDKTVRRQLSRQIAAGQTEESDRLHRGGPLQMLKAPVDKAPERRHGLRQLSGLALSDQGPGPNRCVP
jgi:hypothetical protein